MHFWCSIRKQTLIWLVVITVYIALEFVELFYSQADSCGSGFRSANPSVLNVSDQFSHRLDNDTPLWRQRTNRFDWIALFSVVGCWSACEAIYIYADYTIAAANVCLVLLLCVAMAIGNTTYVLCIFCVRTQQIPLTFSILRSHMSHIEQHRLIYTHRIFRVIRTQLRNNQEKKKKSDFTLNINFSMEKKPHKRANSYHRLDKSIEEKGDRPVKTWA